MKKLFIAVLVIGLSLSQSCQTNSKSNEDNKEQNDEPNNSASEPDHERIRNALKDHQENEDNDSETPNSLTSDGVHQATVEYENPETGYSNTYDLDVLVESRQVTVIYFPKGGFLDGHHIEAADVDEDGHANVEDEDGKTFDVQINS